MKKPKPNQRRIKIVLAILFCFGLIQKSNAQIMIGAGGSYGDDIQQFAPNLRIYFFPNHKICFGPEFAYFPKIKEGGIEKELTEFGISGHYIFKLSESIGFYPLVGINYAIETERELDIHEEKTSLGLNLGGGFHLEYGRFFPFAEYKYVTSDLAQSVFSIGVLFNISKTEKEDYNQ